MKRKESLLIGDILSDILQQAGLELGLDGARVRKVWQETMGEAVNSYTRSLRFDKGTLTVTLASSILRNELFMCRSHIVLKLNTALGRSVVKKIIFR